MKKILFVQFVIAVLFSANVQAQEVTNFDLGRFAHAYRSMVKLNLEAQGEMAKVIEKEGLTLEEYHAINETINNTEIEPDLPKEDFEKYEKVQQKVKTIQSKLEEDVEAAYAKQDLTKRQYYAIAERVKQDRVLQTKLEKILAEMKK